MNIWLICQLVDSGLMSFLFFFYDSFDEDELKLIRLNIHHSNWQSHHEDEKNSFKRKMIKSSLSESNNKQKLIKKILHVKLLIDGRQKCLLL